MSGAAALTQDAAAADDATRTSAAWTPSPSGSGAAALTMETPAANGTLTSYVWSNLASLFGPLQFTSHGTCNHNLLFHLKDPFAGFASGESRRKVCVKQNARQIFATRQAAVSAALQRVQ